MKSVSCFFFLVWLVRLHQRSTGSYTSLGASKESCELKQSRSFSGFRGGTRDGVLFVPSILDWLGRWWLYALRFSGDLRLPRRINQILASRLAWLTLLEWQKDGSQVLVVWFDRRKQTDCSCSAPLSSSQLARATLDFNAERSETTMKARRPGSVGPKVVKRAE